MSLIARVHGLSPFGPIFAKELRSTARRKRSYLLRVAYLGFLLLAMLLAYLGSGVGRYYGGLAAQTEQQARLGLLFFQVFSGFCIIAMGVIGPVLTATAVGSERLQKTLPVLLMTPINTWQILGGKLFSRLLAALTLLGLSLPVLALVRLLGGVELRQMAAVLCLCAAFAMSSAATGLFFSTLMNRAYAVILLGYATALFLYLFVPFVYALTWRMNGPADVEFLAAINPIMCTFLTAEPQALRFVGESWIACVLVQIGLTAALLAASGLALRRSARTAGERETTVDPSLYIPVANAVGPPPLPMSSLDADEGNNGSPKPPPLPGQKIEYAGPEVAPRRLRGPALVFWGPVYAVGSVLGLGPWRKGPGSQDVSDNPILWRELRRPMLAKPWQRVLAVCLTLGILFSLYALIANENDLDDPDTHTVFAVGMHVLMWLLVGVFSATAIASEKEGDTWTLLLATPVSGAAVVWGKAAGLARRLLWPTLLVVAHFLLFIVCGVIHPASLLIVLWVLLAFNSVWVATGIYLSLRLKRVTTAVIANLMLAVLVYGLPFVVLFVGGELAQHRNDDLPELGFWQLPYFWVGSGLEELNRGWGREARSYLSNGTWTVLQPDAPEFSLPGQGRRNASPAEFTGYLFSIGMLHIGVAALILLRTAQHFDRTVGRAGKLAYVGAFDTDEAVFTAPAVAGRSSDDEAAPLEGSTLVLPYASIPRRGVAFAIDGTILISSGATLGLIVGVVRLLILSADGYVRDPETMFLESMYIGIAASLVYGLPYAAFFDSSRWRATPGKSMLGLFVTDAEGRRISFARAALRYVVRIGSTIPLGIGLFMALFDAKRRALHDRAAGTMVLRR